jgi:hypothetical protein
MASCSRLSLVWPCRASSLRSRRWRPNPPHVRSTIPPHGLTTTPWTGGVGVRLASRPAPAVAPQVASGSPLEEPAAQSRSRRGCNGLSPLSRRRAPACAAVGAGVPSTDSRSPRIAPRLCRVRPLPCWPPSSPLRPPASSGVLTLWLSLSAAEGAAGRPARRRPARRRAAWTHCPTPRRRPWRKVVEAVCPGGYARGSERQAQPGRRPSTSAWTSRRSGHERGRPHRAGAGHRGARSAHAAAVRSQGARAPADPGEPGRGVVFSGRCGWAVSGTHGGGWAPDGHSVEGAEDRSTGVWWGIVRSRAGRRNSHTRSKKTRVQS